MENLYIITFFIYSLNTSLNFKFKLEKVVKILFYVIDFQVNMKLILI